jgi:hypothetical protein
MARVLHGCARATPRVRAELTVPIVACKLWDKVAPNSSRYLNRRTDGAKMVMMPDPD